MERLRDKLRTRCCLEFVDAWDRWRGGDLVPRRDMVNLPDIARYLGWLSVLELRSREDMVFRLVGTAINATRDQELTGKTLKELSRPEDWPTRSRNTWAITDHPCGTHFRVRFEYEHGPPAWSEYVCLPVLAAKEGEPAQVFSMRFPQEDVSLRLPQAQPTYNEPGDDNCYIDIGAGVPTDNPMVQDLPPLRL